MSAWISSELTREHQLEAFDSGQEDLDRWLVDHALRAQAAGTARTIVWSEASAGSAVAYYSVAPTQLTSSELPSRSLAGGYSVAPGYLLARLALDRSLQGQGLGSELLFDALTRITDAASRAGGRLIVVDAIDQDAHGFYCHHDFQPIEGSRRLVMKIATARAVLG